MRSDDDDDEDEYEEDNEDDEIQGGMELDPEPGEGDEDEEDSGEIVDPDADGDQDEDEEVDPDAEGDAEGDGSEEQAEDDEDDAEDDGDDSDADDDAEDDDDDAEGDEEEMDIAQVEQTSSPRPSSETLIPKRSSSPTIAPQPPYKVRRSLLVPAYTSRPTHLSIDAIVAIPVPAPIHCLAATACSSYLLTGSQEGVVRAYDFYGSVNGGQAMTAQQKMVVGMGEGMSKAGMARGWWVSDVPGEGDLSGVGERKAEPVYSMAVEGDGLWAATGTQSGPINLYTLRHSPGHLIHSLKGHTQVVSCLTLTTDEKHLLSGSWDGSIREWDLNTGQAARSYPTHGAQLSSLSLRPNGYPTPSPSPPRAVAEDEDQPMADKLQVSVSVGPDFFEAKPPTSSVLTSQPGTSPNLASTSKLPDAPLTQPAASSVDVDMPHAPRSRGSSYDPLFDDEDAEGETVPPSAIPTVPSTPSHLINGVSRHPGLALPGQRPESLADGHGQTSDQPPPTPSRPQGAAGTIPLLSPTAYRGFSDDIMLASFMDGQVMLVDRRIPAGAGGGVRRLLPGDKAPPWCMSACWSGDGNQILAGRRNGTVDIWDVRRSSSSTAPNLLRTLKTPTESGPISCIVAFPDGQHIATASQDNIRLWNTVEYFEPEDSARKAKSRPPFKIVAGHHGGTVSSMLVDPTSRFLTTASGDRGWAGESTRMVLIHEVKW